VNVAGTQETLRQITELVEQEQGTVAGAAEVPVVGCSFLVAVGRAEIWVQVENEGFNVLKTKGYNLKHNFGHGTEILSILLATINLLAFATHTLYDLTAIAWQEARQRTRKRFFQDLGSITG